LRGVVPAAAWWITALLALALAALAAWRFKVGPWRLFEDVGPPSAAGPDRTTGIAAAALTALVLAWTLAHQLTRGQLGTPLAPDLTVFTQSLHNALAGQGLVNTFEQGHHFAVHFSPALWLFVPLFAVAPSPQTLLVLNALGIAAGVPPALLLARTRLGLGASALLVGLLFLHPLFDGVSREFHVVTWGIPALLWAAYFLVRRRGLPFLAALLLALTTQESVALVVAGLGVVLLLLRDTRVAGTVCLLLGALWFVAALGIVMPIYGGSFPPRIVGEFPDLGASQAEAFHALWTRPGLVLTLLLSPTLLWTLAWFVLPLLGLPLLRPATLLPVLPVLLLGMLHGGLHPPGSGGDHHGALAVGFLFLGAVLGAERLATWQAHQAWTRALRRGPRWWRSVAAVAVLGLAFAIGPMRFPPPLDPERATDARAILARIPDGEGAVAPNGLAPYLADRPDTAAYHEKLDVLPPVECWPVWWIVAMEPGPDWEATATAEQAVALQVYEPVLANAHFQLLRRPPASDQGSP